MRSVSPFKGGYGNLGATKRMRTARFFQHESMQSCICPRLTESRANRKHERARRIDAAPCLFVRGCSALVLSSAAVKSLVVGGWRLVNGGVVICQPPITNH